MWAPPDQPPPNQPSAPVGRLYNPYDAQRKRLYTDEQKPLLFEPIKAYRHWQLTGGRLYAPIHDNFHWEPGDNVAWCDHKQRPAKECLDINCGCGFYSVWRQDHQYCRQTAGGLVGGVVALYGKVVVGSSGARASNAKIVAIHLPEGEGWSPFRRHNSLMRNYPEARFYRDWGNLARMEEVRRPDNLVYPNGSYG